jgi:hypothetical protein
MSVFYVVLAMPIARQRVAKHILAEANARNRTSIARQRRSKHAFAKIEEAVFSVGPPRDCISSPVINQGSVDNPCGGGIEYLHRDPASHRRRRKWKSQICDSKIWSRVPDGARHQDLLTDRQSQCDFEFDFSEVSRRMGTRMERVLVNQGFG